MKSFKRAIRNITKFHKKQLPKDIVHKEKNIILKSEWKPIDSVGLYIPGGKAFYPSSLIMNVVPAPTCRVAPVPTFIRSNLVNAILPDPASDCIVTEVPAPMLC